jgi:Flp pilus assembly secretin CpaC
VAPNIGGGRGRTYPGLEIAMNTKLILCTAALLACAAATLASAQSPTPIASTVSSGADPGALGAIVQALNADASLKDTKITVQADGDNILLTGAAQSKEQVQHAGEIATASANGVPVVNVIQPDHTTYQMPDYELAPPAKKAAQ